MASSERVQEIVKEWWHSPEMSMKVILRALAGIRGILAQTTDLSEMMYICAKSDTILAG